MLTPHAFLLIFFQKDVFLQILPMKVQRSYLKKKGKEKKNSNTTYVREKV